MQQLRRNSVSRIVSYVLIAALLAPQSILCLPVLAQARIDRLPGSLNAIPAVVVVPFEDQTGQAGAALMREATAATALALEDSGEYVVTSTADLERELQALRMQPPLATAEQLRLGQRLHADKVLVGNLAGLKVDARTGRAHVELRLMMLDVGIGEYLDGAIANIETKSIPGFSGDVSSIVNEALRQAAEAATNTMLSKTVRRGSVDLVDDQGNINVNLGGDDGLGLGSELLVMRPVWQPDVEQVIMRRIGVIRVNDLESNMAVARVSEGTMPSTGDRIYRIYRPASAQKAVARGRQIKGIATIGVAVALLLGLVAIATGGTTSSASGLECSLVQDAPGESPDILVEINTSGMALDKTHGWLIFRSTSSSVPTTPANMIDYDGRDGALNQYVDEPQVRNDVEAEDEFTFISGDDEEDATLEANFNDPQLQNGTKYYHTVRRFIEPPSQPGSNPPGTQQLPIVATLTVDPDTALSDPADPCGPVTYHQPAIPIAPANGAQNLPTEDITFDWTAATGANDYIVHIFPATDPDGLLSPILQSAVIRWSGSGAMTTTIHGPFDANTTYFWRVGDRQSTDPTFPLFRPTGVNAFLYSVMRSFKTVNLPPPPAGVGPRLPSNHGGPWGTGRRGR
jgi:hypothetical protein